MEVQAQDGDSGNSDASDVITSLTQNLPPETAQHALRLAMAMKNASQDQHNAVLEFLSKPKMVADSDEKPSIETDGMSSSGDAKIDGYNDHGSLVQSPGAPEVCDNDDEFGDHEGKNSGDDLNIDVNGQEDSKNGYVADDKPSHQLDTSDNDFDAVDHDFDAVDKSVLTPSEDQKLAELSDEAGQLADQLSTANENSVGFLQESVSSSEDEKLPELLSNKAEDISSGIEDVDDKEPIESLSDGMEIIRASFVEETPSLQQASILNSLPPSMETTTMEKNEPKIDDDESSSSDDDQMAPSSSHSVVTSSESDLSDAAVPRDSLAIQSEGANDDVIDIEAAHNTLSMTGSKDDDIAIIEDELLHADPGKEPVTKTMPVLERMSSLSSTGTQTSCENLHLLKDQRFNTFGRLEHQNLGNILGERDKGSSQLPFYYQPQIVMHEEKPILILQPVPSSTSSSNSHDNVPGVENGAVKATVPIILPLGSPHIDKETKDAIFQKMNGAGAFPSDQGVVEEISLKSYSGAASPSVNANVWQPNGMDTAPNKSIPITEKWAEASKKTEALPEWVPSSELDKAFSAAAKQTTMTITNEQEPTTLTFPIVSLPSTNPFAKDLAAQEYGHSEAKADDLLDFGPEVTSQYSLFGPPSSPSLSQGARPKEVKVYQDPGGVGNATNPFSPDLTPKNQGKNQGRRQEQKAVDSTEVVVAAEVHTSVGQPSEINRGQHMSHRRRLSSESMVTLIETSYDDPSLNSVESPGADEPIRIVKAETVQEPPKPQQRSTKTSPDTAKPKLKVPGKVAPFWIPDCVCFNCTSCNIKFTLFIRKHHCRGCGKIFCNSCCSQLARFPYMEFKIGRVCSSCTEAIKEVTRLKRIEDSSKPRPLQQSPVKTQEAITAPGLPQRSPVPQTRQLPQGVVVTNAQAQRNLTTQAIQRSAAPSAAVGPLNQGQQRNVSNQPVQYQPLTWPPKSSVKAQNSATPAVPALVPSNQLQQGSQGLMKPAQPANQYMWVPASAIQPSMPVVYVNPVAPSLQGTPMFVTYPQAGQFNPQQAPVMLVPSQPSSTSHLPRTTTQAVTTQAVITTTSGSWKGAAPVSNRSSAETVTTFSVLPQHVGQLAVQSAQRQPTTTANHTSSTASVVPSSSILPVVLSTPQSGHQTTSVQSQLISTAGAASTGLPSSLHQSPPPAVVTAAPSQGLSPAVASSPSGGSHSQESLTGSQRSRESDGATVLAADETELNKDLQPPLRRAGRTITWRYRTQGKSKLQEQKKSLAKDLKDLPHGVTVQASPDLLLHIKKMKLKEGNRDISVWCYQSEGLNKFNHLEVVVMLETRKKEEIFPEEVLRVYRGILHLASTLDNRFEHGNYLSSNNQFLDSSDDAGFIFVSSELKSKPLGLKEMKTPFLYGILVKRSELSAAMFTPSRLLLRLGNKMNSFPFPLWNNRDRRAINLGNEQEDRFFHTVFAMNKYLKNSVPEAMIPGLYVVKEDNKIILQVPSSGRSAIVALLDRLIKKENQTATVPLLADIAPYVNNCKIAVCNERGGKSVKSFGNAANTSVVGLGFLLLHLGVDASSPLSFGGELLDDGVLVFFSKTHTQKLRQSLEAKTNCYFFLGDKFDIAHFELRWVRDVNYHELPKPAKDDSRKTISNPASATTAVDATAKESGADSYPGIATIDIRYSGYGNEVELLKKVFDDYGKILQILEGNIRQACTDPLMKHANKMKPGENQGLQLRVVLRSSYKKWSVGPSDLPTALIRSLQMTLHTVKVPVVFEGELVMSFDVSVVKQ